jgi:hypothetical protein
MFRDLKAKKEKVKGKKSMSAGKLKTFYIIRPEIEIEYKRPVLGRLYMILNYWRFVKIGYCHILAITLYYIAFPRIYRKAADFEQDKKHRNGLHNNMFLLWKSSRM